MLPENTTKHRSVVTTGSVHTAAGACNQAQVRTGCASLVRGQVKYIYMYIFALQYHFFKVHLSLLKTDNPGIVILTFKSLTV